MLDIVDRLRNAAALPTGLYAEAADEIERLRAEVKHWKANHDNRVEAARVLIERNDLPFDRVPAYKHYLHLQEDVAALRAENESLRKDAERMDFISQCFRFRKNEFGAIYVTLPPNTPTEDCGITITYYGLRGREAIDAAIRDQDRN